MAIFDIGIDLVKPHRILLALISLLGALHPISSNASERQELSIRYQAANALKSERRIRFDHDLLHSLSLYTSPNQDLNIVQIKTEMSLNRALKEVENNGLINIIIAPVRSDLSQDTEIVKIPLLKGLLGFRQLVVSNELNHQLEKIRSLDDLRQYKIGQVDGWVDIDIYRSNGFKVNAAANLELAFRMLNGNRFDMLPLGIIELDREYSSRKKTFPNMQVNESFFIYYPLPVMIHVSPNQEGLFDFLEGALQKMAVDGNLDALIKRHFGQAVSALEDKGIPTYQLTNSNLPKEIQTDNKDLWFSNNLQ